MSTTTLSRTQIHRAWLAAGQHGGGFISCLAAAWLRADPTNRARQAAGWTTNNGAGWMSPDGISEAEWAANGFPFPEDPGFAEWFSAAYHYYALDEGVEPIPYPFAPAQAGEQR